MRDTKILFWHIKSFGFIMFVVFAFLMIKVITSGGLDFEGYMRDISSYDDMVAEGLIPEGTDPAGLFDDWELRAMDNYLLNSFVENEINWVIVVAMIIIVAVLFYTVRNVRHQSVIGSLPFGRRQLYLTWFKTCVFYCGAMYLAVGAVLVIVAHAHISNMVNLFFSLFAFFLLTVLLISALMLIEAIFNSWLGILTILLMGVIVEFFDKTLSANLYMYTPYGGRSIGALVDDGISKFVYNYDYLRYHYDVYGREGMKYFNDFSHTDYLLNYACTVILVIMLILIFLMLGSMAFKKNEFANNLRTLAVEIPTCVKTAFITLIVTGVVGWIVGVIAYNLVYDGRYGTVSIWFLLTGNMYGIADEITFVPDSYVTEYTYIARADDFTGLPGTAMTVCGVIVIAVTVIIMTAVYLRMRKIKALYEKRRRADEDKIWSVNQSGI